MKLRTMLVQEIAVNNQIISDCTRFLPTSHSILQSFHVNLISTMQKFSHTNVRFSLILYLFIFLHKYVQIIIVKDLINNHFNTKSTQTFQEITCLDNT